MKSKGLIYCFIIASLSSCIKEYTPEYNSSDQKLVAVAEIEANEFGLINLSSTFSSSLPEIDIDHETSLINIINYESGRAFPEEYRYDKDLESYKNVDFKPKEGQVYDLIVDIGNPSIDIIKATTIVPYSTKIRDIQLLNINTEIDENGLELKQFEIMLLVEPLKNVKTYYHIIPYLYKNDNSNSEKEMLDLVSISSGENASFPLSHRDGILIDQTKLSSDNDLTFKLRTKSTLDLGGIKDSFIYFELRTVTEAYYNFHISLSRQKDSNAGPFTLPVTTFTNIENGYGLFASFSTSLDSVLIE